MPTDAFGNYQLNLSPAPPIATVIVASVGGASLGHGAPVGTPGGNDILYLDTDTGDEWGVVNGAWAQLTAH